MEEVERLHTERNEDGCSKKKRLRGGGQMAAHYDVESSLADWVISERERNIYGSHDNQ